jgi:hypothetical protein
MLTIPLMYEDAEVCILPADDHNPPLMIHVTEYVTLERLGDGSRLVKITMPAGREWALLPADLFSDKVQ